MRYGDFLSIIADIESKLEHGEGYFLHFRTKAGDSVNGGWQWLNHATAFHEIIIVSDNDRPPAYLPISQIESIQVSEQ